MVQRDNHVKHHERQFKCSQPSCDFFTIGFISQAQLNHHLAVSHLKNEHTKRPESNLLNIVHGLDITETMLRDAVKIGHTRYLQTLLEVAKPWIQKNPLGVEGLLCSALQGTSTEIVEILLAVADKDILLKGISENGSSKRDPYFWVSNSGSLEMAEFLISKGVRPGQSEMFYVSGLARACQKSHIEMVQLLLLTKKNWDTTTALQGLIYKSRSVSVDPDIARLLIEHGADVRQVYFSHACSIELAQLLIEKGVDVNKKEQYSNTNCEPDTPLYLAVKANTKKGIEFAKFLLENGADPTIESGNKNLLPRTLVGASKCLKYLGITWDELVASTWGSRQTQKAPTSPAEASTRHNLEDFLLNQSLDSNATAGEDIDDLSDE